MPRYATGKKTSKARKQFDANLETLEYNRDRYHWTDKYFQEQYDKLYKKYESKLSLEQKRDYGRTLASYRHDLAEETIGRYTNAISESGNLEKALQKISEARKNKEISADEAKKMRQEAYRQELEYTKKEVEAGKLGYKDLLKSAEAYWKEVGKDTKEYYESLDILREASKKEIEDKKESQEGEMDYVKKYISLQIDSLNRQKEANEKQKEAVEDAETLVNLQNDLAKARNTMVKVWKEGEGWVYEHDTKAIREAQKALEDYNEEHASDAVDEMISQYQEILDLFDMLGKEAELVASGKGLGIGSILDIVGDNLLNVDYMREWIKESYTWINAYEDLSKQLENMSAEDYEKYAKAGITADMLKERFEAYSYLSSDVYAPTTRIPYGSTINSYGMSSDATLSVADLASIVTELATGKTGDNNFNFEQLVLPNVTDAQTFCNELRNLATRAAQSAFDRV